MKFQRSSGILVHPTSFPSRHGIGDLGDAAYSFLDFMQSAKQSLWQVLPLGPTGYADSPYQCFSAVAGNPMLISLDTLHKQGLLSKEDVDPLPDFNDSYVNYGPVITYKTERLRRAHRNFRANHHPDTEKFEHFCREEAEWLEDYALFMAIKLHHGGGSWVNWPRELVKREPTALAAARTQLSEDVYYQRFIQWLFFEQWGAIRRAAGERGIYIIGDIPLFIAHDSADVWANPHLFYLLEDGNPSEVAGVPPDYFSATGQYWGNPLYRWDVIQGDGFRWWIDRIRRTRHMVDIIRIDHFRGLEAYWEIPVNAERTAVHGRWVKAPGYDLFNAAFAAFGEVPIIAEDLGVITPEVEALRDHYQMPGMRIFQFAFGSDTDNPFLPHNYVPNTVVYTGTHDNETIIGWYKRNNTAGTTDKLEVVMTERKYANEYMNVHDPSQFHWESIRMCWQSVANIAVAPMQDLMALGNEARMNMPGREAGNWQWRYRADQLTTDILDKLLYLTKLYGRNTLNKNNNH